MLSGVSSLGVTTAKRCIHRAHPDKRVQKQKAAERDAPGRGHGGVGGPTIRTARRSWRPGSRRAWPCRRRRTPPRLPRSSPRRPPSTKFLAGGASVEVTHVKNPNWQRRGGDADAARHGGARHRPRLLRPARGGGRRPLPSMVRRAPRGALGCLGLAGRLQRGGRGGGLGRRARARTARPPPRGAGPAATRRRQRPSKRASP